MTFPVRLELPYPPTVNTYWRTFRGRMIISAEGRRYREGVAAHLLASGVRRVGGRLRVSVGLHPPDRRRRDLDNAMKALLDALGGGRVYDDDSQIDRLEVTRLGVVPGGKAVVTVSAWEPPDAS